MSLSKLATSPLCSPTLLRASAASSFSSFPFPLSTPPTLHSPLGPSSGPVTPGLASLEALRASLAETLVEGKTTLRLPRARGRVGSLSGKGQGAGGGMEIKGILEQLGGLGIQGVFDVPPPSLINSTTVPPYATLGAHGAPTPLCSPSLAHTASISYPFASPLVASPLASPSVGGSPLATPGKRARRASFKVDLPEVLTEERMRREGGRVRRVETPYRVEEGKEGEWLAEGEGEVQVTA